eukprot:scaffold11364_cov79-Isochrysis_galbana.AAC.1
MKSRKVLPSLSSSSDLAFSRPMPVPKPPLSFSITVSVSSDAFSSLRHGKGAGRSGSQRPTSEVQAMRRRHGRGSSPDPTAVTASGHAGSARRCEPGRHSSREGIVARDRVDRLDVCLGNVQIGARGQLLEVVLEGFDGSLTEVLSLRAIEAPLVPRQAGRGRRSRAAGQSRACLRRRWLSYLHLGFVCRPVLHGCTLGLKEGQAGCADGGACGGARCADETFAECPKRSRG